MNNTGTPSHSLIETYVNKYYPNVPGVILTGSQTEPDKVTKQSDIDIVLFSHEFNGLTTHSFKDGKVKLDFTKLSLSDLPRILIDHSYDYRGVVLHMIKTGVIIKDDYGILNSVKNKATLLYDSGNASIENELKILRNNLSKVKKNLMKDLDERYHFFILLEFAHLMSSAHLLMNQGWFTSNSYRRTLELLSGKENIQFMNSLMTVMKESLRSDSPVMAHKKKVVNFIDRYLEHPYTSKTNRDKQDRYIVNIKFRSGSITSFNRFIVKKIREDEYLSKIYRYSSKHAYTNVFKYPVVMFFDSGHRDFNESVIHDSLHSLFEKAKKPIEKIKIVSQEYLFREFRNKSTFDSFECILKEFGDRTNDTILVDKKFDKEKFNLIGFISMILLAKAMGIDKNTFQKIMKYLGLKWRYGNGLLSNMDYNQTRIHNQRIQKRGEEYLTRNGHIIVNTMDIVWNDAEGISMNCWDFSSLSLLFQAFAEDLKKQKPRIDKYIIQILKCQIPTEQPLTRTYYYSVCAEQLLNTLMVDKNDHHMITYALFRLSEKELVYS